MDRPLDRPLLNYGLARPLALPLLTGGLALLLGGCSGTPFGERLAGSFSSPPTTAPSTAPTTAPTGAITGGQGPAATAPGAAPGAPTAVQSGAGPGANGAAKPAAKTAAGPAAPLPPSVSPAQAPGAKQAPAAATNLQPVPYRITLKLPQADPAAPAESVTQALRAAGLRFEVEMIERVQPTSSSPVAAPAPR